MDLDAEIVSLMKQNAVRVPPYPAAALKLQALLSRAEHSLDEVVDVVKSDPTLAAAVLRVANSVYFRRGQPATTLKAAVQRVGEKELGRLAMAAGLAHTALKSGPLAELRRGVWHQALTSAVVCEVLARATGGAADEAFVLGLLHDVGKLVALGTLEQILQRHPKEPHRTAAEWGQVVERYHVELGLVLAARWGLPEVVSDAISQHHASTPVGPFASQVELVAAGDVLVALLEAGVSVTEESLRVVSWLGTSEQRREVALAVADAPAVVASFEPDPPVANGRTAVRCHTPPPVERADPEFSVRLVTKDVVCEGVGLTPSMVRFSSAIPLAPNFLSELELEVGNEQVRFWAKVSRCESCGAVHQVDAAPFALAGETLERWQQVTSSKRRAAARAVARQVAAH
ncbi:MAG: HDOD domain-containing protein [Myxococcota bacterium]